MLQLRSPAKINLFLKIVNRRPDGYHNLASLFQAINLVDNLHFQFADYSQFVCDDPRLPIDGSNLIIKAMELFRHKTGWNRPLKISLEKRIPYEAGLGGGSGNAATTLWAMNQLSGQIATEQQLMAWAGELGSDPAFFLSQGTAYCTGRGELLQAMPPLKSPQIWIVKPHRGLSTPAVYKRLDVSKLPVNHPEETLKGFYSGDARYYNDLEIPALELAPDLILLRQQLEKQGYQAVVLCGSGSAFFCIGGSEPQAMEAVRVFPAQFLNRSQGTWY